MSYISIRLINTLYNQRQRSFVYNHLISLSSNVNRDNNVLYNTVQFTTTTTTDTGTVIKTNDDDKTLYNILTIDPLCSSKMVYVKVSVMDHNSTSNSSPFVSALINAARCINIQCIENISIPRLQSLDTKTFRVSLWSFAKLVRDHLFESYLDNRNLMEALFEIPHLKISTEDIVQSFFAFDTYSNCILFLLYAHLLLECTGSSIRFQIEDIYTREFINIKRKCYISTSSNKARRLATTLALQQQHWFFISDRCSETLSSIDKIIKHIIDPVICLQEEKSNYGISDPLIDIIETVRTSHPDKEGNIENNINDYYSVSIPIGNLDNENYIYLYIRKEARLINSNKQILFPVHGRQKKKTLYFLNLSKEAKVLLLLPYFFPDKTTSCMFGDSILRDERRCTFILADFIPIHLG